MCQEETEGGGGGGVWHRAPDGGGGEGGLEPNRSRTKNSPNQYRGGKKFKRFFFRMTKIKGVKNWYCSLEMKENFGMRPLAATS